MPVSQVSVYLFDTSLRKRLLGLIIALKHISFIWSYLMIPSLTTSSSSVYSCMPYSIYYIAKFFSLFTVFNKLLT